MGRKRVLWDEVVSSVRVDPSLFPALNRAGLRRPDRDDTRQTQLTRVRAESAATCTHTHTHTADTLSTTQMDVGWVIHGLGWVE